MLNKESRKHILRSLSEGVRYDGRGLDEFREVAVEFGISKNAEGSARVSIGDTVVLAGVKMAIEKPYPDTPNNGNLMINAELTPLSSPDFESGPPGDEAIEIARVVDRGIREAHAIDVEKLCITSGEKVWSVMIDIVSLNEDGNLLDAAALAAVAALQDARFPTLDENGKIDYKKRTDKRLPLSDLPITVTVVKIGDKMLVDVGVEEKENVDARLTIATMPDGTVCAMQKGGEGSLTLEEIGQMLALARSKAKELRAKVEQ